MEGKYFIDQPTAILYCYKAELGKKNDQRLKMNGEKIEIDIIETEREHTNKKLMRV